MVQADKLLVDVKTGETKKVKFNYTPWTVTEPPKGVDLEKLKAVLKSKGVIADTSDIE